MGVVGKKRIHVPEPLGEEDGWTLFCKNIWTDDVSKYTELKEIGLEIVRKCDGLPLAIKVMGGVVSSYEISAFKWKKIRDSFKRYISYNMHDSIVMGSLELSYDDLPEGYLQQCLLCFALFPEGFVIEKDKIIRWWIGEGFVPLTEDERVSVELAERCLDELINRSLVEVVTRDYRGKVYKCKVDNFVREMLEKKGKSELFFENKEHKVSRRILFNGNISTASNQISASSYKVRAIVSTSTDSKPFMITKEFLDKICDVCKYLKVLDLSDNTLEYPKKLSRIENLKHLTCLRMAAVPTNISDLKSLLVLCLSTYCTDTLPDFITELKQLIWLDVRGCSNLKYLPKGLGNVSTLQVLKGFVPSENGCRFEELRKLTQLVTLEMRIESADPLSDGELDALSKLDCLRYLNIECIKDEFLAKKLDKLVLPKKLDGVSLLRYPGDFTPSWLCTEDLPYLRYLSFDEAKFKDFNKKFYEGKEWGITHLTLEYTSLPGDWNVISGRMPHLKTVNGTECYLINWKNFQKINEKGFWMSAPPLAKIRNVV